MALKWHRCNHWTHASLPLPLKVSWLEAVEAQDLLQVSERRGQNLNLSHGDRSWANYIRFIFKRTFRSHIQVWKIAQINNRKRIVSFQWCNIIIWLQ